MKKIYALVLAAALLLLGTQANAQFHIGVGYLNSTEITHYNNGDKPFSEMMHGFYLGGTFNIKVAGNFGIAPGFYIDALFQEELYREQPKYYQSRFGGFNFESGIYRELALNVPVNLTYDFEINDNVSISSVYSAGPHHVSGRHGRSGWRCHYPQRSAHHLRRQRKHLQVRSPVG